MQVLCGVSAEKGSISPHKRPHRQLAAEEKRSRRESVQPESVEEAFNLVCRLILQDFEGTFDLRRKEKAMFEAGACLPPS